MILLPERVEDLIDFDQATLRVSSREGKHREFKRQFERADLYRYTKVLSALCNTDGGSLIFGVAERESSVREGRATQPSFRKARYTIGKRVRPGPSHIRSCRPFCRNGTSVVSKHSCKVFRSCRKSVPKG